MAKAVTSQTICAEFAYKFKRKAFLQKPNFYSVFERHEFGLIEWE